MAPGAGRSVAPRRRGLPSSPRLRSREGGIAECRADTPKCTRARSRTRNRSGPRRRVLAAHKPRACVILQRDRVSGRDAGPAGGYRRIVRERRHRAVSRRMKPLSSPATDGSRSGWREGGHTGTSFGKRDTSAKRADGRSKKMRWMSGDRASSFITLRRSTISKSGLIETIERDGWMQVRTRGSRLDKRERERQAKLAKQRRRREAVQAEVHRAG